MRKLVLLVIFVGVLIGTGILSVKWGNGTFSFHIDKEKAKEKTAELVEEAKVLEARIKTEIESDDEDTDSSDTQSMVTPRIIIQDEDEAALGIQTP